LANERIEKIRKVMEPDEEGGAPDVDKIIKRLKSAQGVARNPAISGGALRERLEGRPEGEVDFSRSSLAPRAAGQSAVQGDSFLSFVGRFYSAFQRPVSWLASIVSKMPGVSSLHADLEAADISVSLETYIITSTVAGILAAFFSFPLLGLVVAAARMSPATLGLWVLLAPMAFFATVLVALYYPKTLIAEKTTRINRELPFALRHLSTQIKAGVSFHRALSSVTASAYGDLSLELRKTLRELERGSSTEEALLNLAKRTHSTGLKKAIVQIIRALKTGGNLSQVINDIADDSSFEYQMRLRDFVEKLNIINVVFTMIAVVGPVTITIISAVAQLPMLGGALPFALVVAMLGADAAAMAMIVWFITKMESSV
jgi:flagellar protein FlaJ